MLPELQRHFRDYLLGTGENELALAVLPDGLSGEARLRVYRNHVRISLREALRTTFPVTHRLVGEAFFAALARAFIARHPPASPCLSEFGGALPGFIAGFAPGAQLSYLSDLAQLEWALHAAWHRPLAVSLSAADLAAVDPDTLAGARIILQPSLRCVASAYPVDAIWRANQPDRDGSGVDLRAGPVRLLVWRDGEDAAFRSVSPERFTFVQSLLAGETLGQSLALPTAAESLAELLAGSLVTDWKAF